MQSDTTKILSLVNVKKVYKTKTEEIEILKNINLDIYKGDMISITGKSGSGKTTLLNILGMLSSPTKGYVLIHNKENENKIYKTIGFIFQFHHLLKEFSALENVMLPRLIHTKNKKELEKKAISLLELVGLKDRIYHKPDELSGGEKQRVAIARALINDPEILLADEPTGNLDNKTSESINNLFIKINKELNQSIIIVTHSSDLANICKIKYELKDGSLCQID